MYKSFYLDVCHSAIAKGHIVVSLQTKAFSVMLDRLCELSISESYVAALPFHLLQIYGGVCAQGSRHWRRCGGKHVIFNY